MTGPSLIVATAAHPGAVGILQLHGPGSRDAVRRLTGRGAFADDRLYLVRFADVDEGLAVCRGADWAQLMPHGGVRVVEKIARILEDFGVVRGPQVDARLVYPEADSAIEADMLAALARTPSPAAIDLLLAQPRLWREHIRHSTASTGHSPKPVIRNCDHLLTPPAVVVAGAPNVGKSTLANAMLGRSSSLVSELPGATRDWVGSLAEISDGGWRMADGGWASVAVHWIDTPGIRDGADPVEREAIRLSQQVIESADVLIAMRDPSSEYPRLPGPREPDVRVVNKMDTPGSGDDPRQSRGLMEDELPISALHRLNLDELQRRVLRALGLRDLSPDTLWAFSPTLNRFAAGEAVDLQSYTRALARSGWTGSQD